MATSAPNARNALAQPQAIEFSLAMPTTRPFLPSRSFAFTGGIIVSASCSRVRGGGPVRLARETCTTAWPRGRRTSAAGHDQRRDVEAELFALVGAERSDRHAAPFLRRECAHSQLHPPRFVVQSDPAQLADQFSPFIRRPPVWSLPRSHAPVP